ncbi:MAG TPA: hypothetical protein VIR30_05695 [Nocardioides sp.]
MPNNDKARTREKHVRAFARDNIRAGLLQPQELLAEIKRAVRDELPWLPIGETISTWLREESATWAREAADWPLVTDYDRLQGAFEELGAGGVVVLQGCEDHWAARDVLTSGTPSRGVAWFMPQDVWHAIDEGMLEVNVWHTSGANAAPGDALLQFVLQVFADHGLEAHFDEGRVEVSAFWQRRP